ncbi:MAG: hypothetical protein Q8919_04425 [Bacteroidota bacterium]|nr:hypothetical protein [Bacteroidota bacterium]
MTDHLRKNKIPEVTLLFWIMKISATTLGETAGDLLSMTLNVGYAISSIILLSGFALAVTGQLFAKRNIPVLYWAVILATSTAGTTMSDYMDRTLGLGYATGSLILVTVLIVVLRLWHYSEKSLSVTNIKTFKGELFYWTAILFSNTLGTALGDFLADNSGLGFAGGALLITALLSLVVLAYYFTKASRIVLFWIAFVLTRPFGATFGDVLTKTPQQGGLGFGTMGSSMILLAILVVLVIYETVHHRKKANMAITN